MRIALAQINPIVGDLEGNAEKIKDFLRQAQGYKADIVAFPELSVTGYPPEDLLLKEHFVRDNLNAVASIVKEVSGLIAIIGFVDQDATGNLFNAACVVQDKKIKGVYHKIDLPNYGVFDEKRYFQPGTVPYVFNAGGIVFGVNICEDIWKEKGATQAQAKNGARIIFNISASPYFAGKRTLKLAMLKQRARRNNIAICYTNIVGGQDELVFDGGSLIMDPHGKLVAAGKQFQEDLIISDIALQGTKKIKTKQTVLLQKIPQVSKPAFKKEGYRPYEGVSEIYHALVIGTRDYLTKNGFKKAVVGLSGGIDSSLVAAIACDALGKENVIGISMPSQYSSRGTQDDAQLLAKNLGIRFIVIGIQDIFGAFLSGLKNEFVQTAPGLAEENLQARIRGTLLMAFSNKFNWLVLTTGNKSETSVGYCTLYGDMAGGFAIIKDVPKMLVYELSRYVNQRAAAALIPESVFTRPPTAELRENQKDSDSLPEYPVLDGILKQYVEENKSVKAIVSKAHLQESMVKDVIKKVDTNEYKRRQAPPGVKITPLAFGKDRRMPLTNAYRG